MIDSKVFFPIECNEINSEITRSGNNTVCSSGVARRGGSQWFQMAKIRQNHANMMWF